MRHAIELQKMTVTISRNSRSGPARFLQFNLAFESFCKINNQQLYETESQSDACK